jgi:hypothetical protein
VEITMKLNTLKKTIFFSVASALLTIMLAANANAGARTLSRHVAITNNADGSGNAVATLGGVYNGTGVQETFGCGKVGSSGDFFYCFIKDESGNFKTCDGPTSSFLTQSFSTISSDARVQISWNASGRCTTIEVMHASDYEDKQ